jgi:hypothetical protein
MNRTNYPKKATCQLKSSSSCQASQTLTACSTLHLLRPPSRPQRLTLKHGYTRDHHIDRRIHRQIEGGARSAYISVYTVRNERQRTEEAKEPRESAVHADARSTVRRFGSCGPNCSSPDAASTKASGEPWVTDVLRTGRADSQRTGSNSFIRSSSHAV